MRVRFLQGRPGINIQTGDIMPKTTVIWKFNPNQELDIAAAIKERRLNYAESLAGADFRAHQNETFNESDATLTVNRDWPDQATAEAWITFVNSEGALFAAIDPE
jgi:hypothetical protein